MMALGNRHRLKLMHRLGMTELTLSTYAAYATWGRKTYRIPRFVAKWFFDAL